jgi:Zn-finger nucleic acid-binding protein
MVVFEVEKVEVDHCLGCGGIWLDAGELQLLLRSAADKDRVLDSFETDKENKEKKRRCPICLKKMGKILCCPAKKILIDKCRKNDGLWFDLGELNEIIKAGGLDKDNRVLVMLEDMFNQDLKRRVRQK